MHANGLTQYITELLALALVIRLIVLRVVFAERVYVFFCWFLSFQILDSIADLALHAAFHKYRTNILDYRIFWVSSTVILSVLSLCVIYSLSTAVLRSVPGVARFSRMLLKVVFPGALVLALVTAPPEYSALTVFNHATSFIAKTVVVGFVLDRAIAMAAVTVLLAVLAFILWFPVRMPRNLAIFSIGFVVYFASKTGLHLIQTYVSPASIALISTCINFVLDACFVYWLFFIDAKGQEEITWGHIWQRSEQNRLLGQLESLNAALLRSSRQLELK